MAVPVLQMVKDAMEEHDNQLALQVLTRRFADVELGLLFILGIKRSGTQQLTDFAGLWRV